MPELLVEILLQDRLDDTWAGWFQGLRLEPEEAGATRIRGVLADQSALHGLLERIRDLNLHLSSVHVNPQPSKGK